MISVGIDVAKGKSKICIMKPGGEVIMAPKDFRHTKNELQRLVVQALYKQIILRRVDELIQPGEVSE